MHSALVIAQFALIAAIALNARMAHPLPVPVGLMAIGLALGLWALAYNRPGNFNIRPRVKEGARLIVTGPYRFMRHPMYSALILACAGLALNGWPDATGAWSFGALLPVLAAKMGVEERLMAARFPEYRLYATRTARLFPGIL